MIAKQLLQVLKPATGGGGAFSPTQLAGLLRWYSATDVAVSGSNVTQLNDKSGNNNHATQATGTKQPILKTNQGSGFQTVSFDGVDDIVSFASMTLTGDFTVYWFGYMRETDGNSGGFFGEAESSPYSLNTFSQGTYWATAVGDIAQGNDGSINNGLFCTIVARRTGTTVTVEVNGVTNSTSGPVNANPIIGQIGKAYFGFAKIDLCEFLVYSQFHSQATEDQIVNWAALTYKDPYFDKVSVLLHMDGSNGSTTFVDSGPNALAVTAVGGAQITSGSKYGTGAAAVGGANYVTLPNNASLFDFGTSDFTIEFWFYYSSSITGQIQIFARSANQTGSLSPIFIEKKSGTNYIGVSWTSSGSAWVLDQKSGTTAMTPNAWNHVAIVRKSGTFYSYINGTLDWSDSTSSASAVQNGGDVPAIGRWPKYANSPGTFYIDDFRITRTGRPNTVPTSAFPDLYNPYTTLPVAGAALWLDASQQSSLFTDAGATNVIKDGDAVYQWNDLSGNSRTATQTTSANRPAWLPPAKGRNGLGALSFNGSQYLNISSPNAAVGTSDFTVEYWFKITSSPASYAQIAGNYNNSAYIGFGIINDAGLKLYATTLTVGYKGATSLSVNTWYHAAFVRQSGTLKIYLNGTLDSTFALSTSFTTPSWQIGGTNTGQYFFAGQVQNVLFYNGQALYTSNFTPWMS